MIMEKINYDNVLENALISAKQVALTKQTFSENTERLKIELLSNKDANKWTAIQFLIEKLGIKAEEVISMGDNINDLKMIENSGLGVVMKNSALEKQNVGNFVTEDNNSDGVGEAIYRYI